MNKEINDIISAYQKLAQEGRRAALATIVHVEGSSYRRPGARMLVADDGRMTGAISGGCLEGDALRKALLAINQDQNKLVTYNTLDDDLEIGVQLGCNGIVHILFEPIHAAEPYHPIALLEKCLAQRRDVVLATLFSIDNYHGHQPGTCFYFDGDASYHNIRDHNLSSAISQDVQAALQNKTSSLKVYPDHTLMGFIEWLQPAISLVIVGAGNDAIPLVQMAAVLGWHTTVVDGRPTHASSVRFPQAARVIVAKPAAVIDQISIDERTAIVLMTHNYYYDQELLGLLSGRSCGYIGMLGPKQKLLRMLGEMEDNGKRLSEAQLQVIYGPTGLDIGAEAAEEIALSILAEIKTVLSHRNGSFLRDKQEGIHEAATPKQSTIH